MKSRGFSLIELIVVMIIIGLSASLVTPFLSRISRATDLKGAAKKVSGILRYYRSEAVHKGVVYQVLFDSNLREVEVQWLESTEGKEDGEQKTGNVHKKKYSLPTGINMKEIKLTLPQYSSDTPVIEFYPNGGSNGGSVLLDSQDRKGYRINVHFLTGMVEIERV